MAPTVDCEVVVVLEVVTTIDVAVVVAVVTGWTSLVAVSWIVVVAVAIKVSSYWGHAQDRLDLTDGCHCSQADDKGCGG